MAGRLMSKRGMGKVSFCDMQDKTGRIQLYARRDEMDEAVYNEFKKYDIGDMALIGKPIKGRIIATRPGHTVNNKFARLMRKEIRKHEIQAPIYDPNEEPIMDNILSSVSSVKTIISISELSL